MSANSEDGIHGPSRDREIQASSFGIQSQRMRSTSGKRKAMLIEWTWYGVLICALCSGALDKRRQSLEYIDLHLQAITH